MAHLGQEARFGAILAFRLPQGGQGVLQRALASFKFRLKGGGPQPQAVDAGRPQSERPGRAA